MCVHDTVIVKKTHVLYKLDSYWPDSAVKRLQNKQQLFTKYPKFEFTQQFCIIDLNTQEIYT